MELTCARICDLCALRETRHDADALPSLPHILIKLRAGYFAGFRLESLVYGSCTTRVLLLNAYGPSHSSHLQERVRALLQAMHTSNWLAKDIRCTLLATEDYDFPTYTLNSCSTLRRRRLDMLAIPHSTAHWHSRFTQDGTLFLREPRLSRRERGNGTQCAEDCEQTTRYSTCSIYTMGRTAIPTKTS